MVGYCWNAKSFYGDVESLVLLEYLLFILAAI